MMRVWIPIACWDRQLIAGTKRMAAMGGDVEVPRQLNVAEKNCNNISLSSWGNSRRTHIRLDSFTANGHCHWPVFPF